MPFIRSVSSSLTHVLSITCRWELAQWRHQLIYNKYYTVYATNSEHTMRITSLLQLGRYKWMAYCAWKMSSVMPEFKDYYSIGACVVNCHDSTDVTFVWRLQWQLLLKRRNVISMKAVAKIVARMDTLLNCRSIHLRCMEHNFICMTSDIVGNTAHISLEYLLCAYWHRNSTTCR